MTRDELLGAIEKRWPLWGPCSGGGEELVYAKGRLWVFAYGDAVMGDSDVTEVDLASVERVWGANDRATDAIAWLKAKGAIP